MIRGWFEGECSGDMVDLRLAAGRQQYLDDIHAAGDGALQPQQPELCHAPEHAALVLVDSAGRASGSGMQRAFHLGKDKHIPLAADDVDLAMGIQPETLAQDFVSLCPEPGGRHQFAVFTQIGTLGATSLSPGAVPVV